MVKALDTVLDWGGEVGGAEYIRATVAEGLRVCRTYRDLIELHQPRGGHKSPDAWYGDQNECQTCGGYELEAGLGARGHRSKWPCATLQALARGLGVEEQSSE